MNKVAPYNKLVVALVGAVVQGLSVYYGSPEWLQLVVPVLVALGVYRVPNVSK